MRKCGSHESICKHMSTNNCSVHSRDRLGAKCTNSQQKIFTSQPSVSHHEPRDERTTEEDDCVEQNERSNYETSKSTLKTLSKTYSELKQSSWLQKATDHQAQSKQFRSLDSQPEDFGESVPFKTRDITDDDKSLIGERITPRDPSFTALLNKKGKLGSPQSANSILDMTAEPSERPGNSFLDSFLTNPETARLAASNNRYLQSNVHKWFIEINPKFA